jgi:hypothetical protein
MKAGRSRAERMPSPARILAVVLALSWGPPLVGAVGDSSCDPSDTVAIGAPGGGFALIVNDVPDGGDPGVWLYQETNGLEGVQRGGSSTLIPDDTDLCTSDADEPDALIL